MRRIRTLAAVAASFLVAAPFLAACDKSSATDSGEIVIGATLPMTGVSASYGKVQSAGLLLGLKDAQAALDGITFKTIVEDDQAQAAPAVTLGTKLMADDKAQVLVTSFAAPPLAQLGIAERYQVPLLNGGGNTPDLENHDWLFNGALNLSQGATVVLKYAHDTLGVDNIAILIDTSFTSATNDFYAKAWPEIAGNTPTIVSVPGDTTDASSYVAQAMASHPDAIFVNENSNAMTLTLSAIRQANITVPLLNQSGSFLLATTVDQITQPVYYPLPATTTSTALTQEYKDAYGEEPNVYAVQMYNLGLIIGQAAGQLKAAGKPITGANIQALLNDPSSTFTVDGGASASFNAQHTIDQAVSITQWQAGVTTTVQANVSTA